ncbi:sterile alpha motif domain-containing protein 7 [Erinaceus europaeus]|uniref:Sterile alpha motif domain-containing protein 7 n=1 Tax=Erinaceus europaeus TaxID=9365 RepID=A0A1S2ZQK5_ERIEU|nr:sterile alpha motif domain-containing protein 7 [Erinaceus europaeus]
MGSSSPQTLGRHKRLSSHSRIEEEEELQQWREILMINSMTAVNPLLTTPGQPKIPQLHSPFEPPVVDRDVLPSMAAPPDPRQFCISSQFGSCLLPNAIMPNTLPSPTFPGWGILPPKSMKAMAARRDEMLQRHQHSARMEMEAHAIYQQRRIEKVNANRLTGLGIPFLYGSSIPAGSATYQGRSMLSASDLHFHSNPLRNFQGNPMLVASSPHFLESWRQKCRRLRRCTNNQKALDSDTESSKSHTEAKILVQTHVCPYEEVVYRKDPEAETLNNQSEKPSESNEQPAIAQANSSGEFESMHRKLWGVAGALLEARAWDSGKKKTSELVFAASGEKNGVHLPVLPSLPGPHALAAGEGNPSLGEDIQKWTVTDVHNFISSLPGCSEYAQVFKDHRIDGETLPLLTEEHLRSTLGLKLGPALKIQSQVSQHVESMCCKQSLPPAHAQPAGVPPTALCRHPGFSSWGVSQDAPATQDVTIPTGTEADHQRN